MPSYQKCKSLEENSIPYWVKHFKNYRNVIRVQVENGLDIQTEEHWDLLIILKGNYKPLRVDVKTRSMDFYKHYVNDSEILVEINGNTSNSDTGSSVFNSNALTTTHGIE